MMHGDVGGGAAVYIPFYKVIMKNFEISLVKKIFTQKKHEPLLMPGIIRKIFYEVKKMREEKSFTVSGRQ